MSFLVGFYLKNQKNEELVRRIFEEYIEKDLFYEGIDSREEDIANARRKLRSIDEEQVIDAYLKANN